MQDIVISTYSFPTLTGEDASLLLIKNDVLVNQLKVAEDENARLRKIIRHERDCRYRMYKFCFSKYYRCPGLEPVQKLFFTFLGAAVSSIFFMLFCSP